MCIRDSPCILSRCPHHVSLAASTLFIMGFTPTLSLTVSFLTLSSRLSNHCLQHIHLRCLNSTLLSLCHAPCLRPIQQYRRQHSFLYCSLHLFVHIFIFQDAVSYTHLTLP